MKLNSQLCMKADRLKNPGFTYFRVKMESRETHTGQIGDDNATTFSTLFALLTWKYLSFRAHHTPSTAAAGATSPPHEDRTALISDLPTENGHHEEEEDA